LDEVQEEIRRRQREATEVRRKQDQARNEQTRRIREAVREAAKMLRGDGPEGRDSG
jgi:hypothetical protein